MFADGEGRTGDQVPTGVAIRDPRGQLFDAAERVLLRDGVSALTSRSVTAEAGVAKGVLHRHFADFDAFLAELTLDRIAPGADIATLAPTLIGAAHLLFADAGSAPPDAAAITRVVTTVLAGVTA